MSIESKEVRDIHALYQNLHEETARERMQKNKERVKNPFGKTTIGTPDGKELKQGDPGFKAALSNARQTVRDANNKSLGKDNNSSSSSSSSSVVKKETPVVKKETPVVKKDIPPAPKTQRDEVVTRGQGNRPIASNPNRQDKEKPTPSIARGQGNRPIASNPNRQGGEPFKKLLQQKSDKENDVGSDGKPVTPGNRGASINVNRDGSPKPKPEIKLKDPGVITPKVATPKVEIPKVETPKVDPKPVKMHSLEKKNRAMFGDKAIDHLKAKQVDFKKMQSKDISKDDFIKKYPKSITAQKSAGLRDHYDPFDIVLGYLVESEQVDSMDEALYIMMEMDAATIQGIVRDFEILSEEAADKEKDDRLVKYGIGHDGSDRKAGSGGSSDSKRPKGKTNPQKEAEKKHGKGKSPLDVAKANIIAKYGKGAIAPSKKKKK